MEGLSEPAVHTFIQKRVRRHSSAVLAMRVARAIALRALCALALAVTPVVANGVPASRTYACTATCDATTPTTATACGIGNATNTWCGATTPAYAYEGCTAERCDDVCGNDASVTANSFTAAAPVSVIKYGKTFDCFKASSKMQSSAALATQQSVAMNCGPANHAMSASYMPGASHTACDNWDNTVAAAPSAAARGTPTTLAATLAATLATLATLAAA